MNQADFIYANNFPGLSSTQIQLGIDTVETMWYGVLQFWSYLPTDVMNKKRLLVESLLVGWYLANVFPGEVVGIVSNGGMPLSSKTIGGVSVSFADIGMQDALKPLMSNTFGMMAAEMILSANERFSIYG